MNKLSSTRSSLLPPPPFCPLLPSTSLVPSIPSFLPFPPPLYPLLSSTHPPFYFPSPLYPSFLLPPPFYPLFPSIPSSLLLSSSVLPPIFLLPHPPFYPSSILLPSSLVPPPPFYSSLNGDQGEPCYDGLSWNQNSFFWSKGLLKVNHDLQQQGILYYEAHTLHYRMKEHSERCYRLNNAYDDNL